MSGPRVPAHLAWRQGLATASIASGKAVPLRPGSGEAPLRPAPTTGPQSGRGGHELSAQAGGSPALGADAAGAAADLAVDVQEARAVTPGLLRADLRGTDRVGGVAGAPPRPSQTTLCPGYSLATL